MTEGLRLWCCPTCEAKKALLRHDLRGLRRVGAPTTWPPRTALANAIRAVSFLG